MMEYNRKVHNKRETADVIRPDFLTVLSGPFPDEKERLANLYIAVIEQAMCDATLGVSRQIREGKPIRPFMVSTNCGGGMLNISEVWSARYFIKGRDGAMADIMAVLGLDYHEFMEQMLALYAAYQEHLPDEWKDTDFIDQSQKKGQPL